MTSLETLVKERELLLQRLQEIDKQIQTATEAQSLPISFQGTARCFCEKIRERKDRKVWIPAGLRK